MKPAVPLPQPDYYDDLALSLAHTQGVLAKGCADRQSAAHAPVVSTVDAKGCPQQRIMILRAVDWPARVMRFHTDIRSVKVGELATAHAASVLIYDAPAKLQLRFAGTARVSGSMEADAPWAESTPFARRCYLAEAAPGLPSPYPTSGLPDWIEGIKPKEEQLTAARANFALLLMTFDTIDWLYLANDGHRRARFEWQETGWTGSWVVP